MAPINRLFAEIKFEIIKVVALNAFLDATIVFLAALLVLSVFGISIGWALGIAAAFLVYDWIRISRRLSLRYIEDRNPEVREMLRTAADNRSSDSLMAHALFSEVIERVRTVSSGTFLDFRRLMLKVGAVFVLSFLLVSLAFLNVNVQKFENPLRSVEDQITGYWSRAFGDADMSDPGIDLADDIYGEPSIAKLGDDALDITLQQNLNQIDFTNVGEAEQTGSTPPTYPVDVDAQASQAYTGGLSDVSDRKAAAEYSQEVKK